MKINIFWLLVVCVFSLRTVDILGLNVRNYQYQKHGEETVLLTIGKESGFITAARGNIEKNCSWNVLTTNVRDKVTSLTTGNQQVTSQVTDLVDWLGLFTDDDLSCTSKPLKEQGATPKKEEINFRAYYGAGILDVTTSWLSGEMEGSLDFLTLNTSTTCAWTDVGYNTYTDFVTWISSISTGSSQTNGLVNFIFQLSNKFDRPSSFTCDVVSTELNDLGKLDSVAIQEAEAEWVKYLKVQKENEQQRKLQEAEYKRQQEEYMKEVEEYKKQIKREQEEAEKEYERVMQEYRREQEEYKKQLRREQEEARKEYEKGMEEYKRQVEEYKREMKSKLD